MAQFTIPSSCVIGKSNNNSLLLLKEEPSRFYDKNLEIGYFKVLIPKNGKFYSNGLYVTRRYDEVFKTVEEAKLFKPLYLK